MNRKWKKAVACLIAFMMLGSTVAAEASTAIRPSILGVTPWTKKGNAYYSSNGSVINGAYAKGIDVSKNNGQIDWKAVKADGIDFAIIRCGYGENRVEQDDIRWEENAAGAAAARIPYGVYLYSYADTVSKAVNEAQHVLRLLNGRKLSYPVYYDMEDPAVFASTTAEERGKIAKAFCKKIEAAGYKAAIYASASAFTNQLPEQTFNQWNRWVAHYSTKCGYNGTYHMWQATNQGRVAGIEGNVDINFLISNQIFLKPEITVASSGKKTARITWRPRKKGNICHVYYSRKKTGGYKRIQKNARNGYTKIKNLKSGKKYYFKLRISKKVNGITVYSKYSKIKALKIR